MEAKSVNRIATYAVVTAWLVLVTWQFTSNPSLFIDELALVNNVLARDVADLVTRPLDYDQVAPVGFLAVLKLSSVAFGSSEMALRLVPLFGVLCAAGMFVVLARRAFRAEVVPVVLAVFLLARSTIRTTTLVKQYGLDLGVAVGLLWIGVELARGRRVHPAWLVLAMLAPWFSHPAVFLLPAVAAAWALNLRRKGNGLKLVAAWTAVWGVTALGAVIFARALLPPGTNQYMHGYWELALWPLWPLSVQTVLWPAVAMRDALGNVASLPWPKIGLLVLAVGAWHTFRTDRPTTVLLLLPIALAMGASAFGLYPYSDRTISFLLPVFALLTGAAFEAFVVALGGARRRLVTVVATLLVAGRVAHLVVMGLPPYSFQHVRPVLARVASTSVPGDRYLVTYGAEQAWRYYAPRSGLSDRPVTFLPCRRGLMTGYLDDVKQLDSGRVWLIHVLAARFQTPSLLLHELSQRGAVVATFPANAKDDVSAHLIDLDAPPTVKPGAAPPSINLDPPGPCEGPALMRPPIP